MSIKSATIEIKIQQFRPLGVIPITAKMSLGKHDKCFSLVGKNITIRLKRDDDSQVQIKFVLRSQKHLLIGIAFAGVDGKEQPIFGQKEFPHIEIRTLGDSAQAQDHPTYRELTITDAKVRDADRVSYDYVIMVQELGTGQVGIIDPDIETEFS